MRARVGIAGLLVALLLAACGRDQAIKADQPVAQVHGLLADAAELPPVFGSDEPDLRMETADPKSVSWILSVRNEEVMRFVASLTPQGESETSIDLRIEAPPKFEKRLDENDEVRNFYLAAMREQVASVVERRPFDLMRTYPQMRKAIAANIGNFAASAERAAEASRKRDKENIERAYAREAAGEYQ